MIGRRRESHRRPHRGELTGPEWISLAFGHVDGDAIFSSDEDRHEAWLAHRHEDLVSCPGTRPAAWWEYEADDAPGREDFMVPASWPWEEGERVDSDALEEARFRYLAERGLLGEDEIAALLQRRRDPSITPYARERAQRAAEAVLGGLANRQEEAA